MWAIFRTLRKTSFSVGGPIFYFSYVYSAFSRDTGNERLRNKKSIFTILFLISLFITLLSEEKLRYYQGVSDIV